MEQPPPYSPEGQQQGYPPQSAPYPPQQQQPGYPPQKEYGGGYPPQGQGYPPQGQGYPPQGHGYVQQPVRFSSQTSNNTTVVVQVSGKLNPLIDGWPILKFSNFWL